MQAAERIVEEWNRRVPVGHESKGRFSSQLRHRLL